MSKVESPEQKVERLWGELSDQSKSISNKLNELEHLATPEQTKLRKQLEEAERKAREDLEKLKGHEDTEAYKEALEKWKKVDGELRKHEASIANEAKINPSSTVEEKEKADRILEELERYKETKNKFLQGIEERAKRLGTSDLVSIDEMKNSASHDFELSCPPINGPEDKLGFSV